MEQKEYLSEENYEKSKKKIVKLAIIILVLGIVVGGFLITIGIIKSTKVDKEDSNSTRTAEIIEKEADELRNEKASLEAKQSAEFKENGFSEEYYRLDNEISSKQRKILELQTEKWKLTSGFNKTSSSMEKMDAVPFYMFGAFIIIASLMGAGSVYMFAKGREIAAFKVQQTMPLAKEGVEKMSPTVEKSIGGIAKSITKGIKEGLDDKDK